MKHRTAAIAALIILTIAGCSAAQPASQPDLDADLDVVAAQSETAPGDDPFEQWNERREALLERQNREHEELLAEFDSDVDPWEEAEKCRAEAMTYDAQDACDLIEEEAEADTNEFYRRQEQMLERHDEEEDALNREFEELGGITIP